jgi:hypothetical protein
MEDCGFRRKSSLPVTETTVSRLAVFSAAPSPIPRLQIFAPDRLQPPELNDIQGKLLSVELVQKGGTLR